MGIRAATVPRVSRALAIGALLTLSGLFLLGDPSATRPLSAAEEESPVHPRSVRVPIGSVDERSTTSYTVTLTNRSPRAVKVLGSGSVCGMQGCVKAVDIPAAIQAQESIDIKYLYGAMSAGPVELTAAIYLDIGGKTGIIVPITFVGSVVASERSE